ncbi:hypothetical protein [Geodermatophilus sabuli]|uniref:Uncharacterized protein n=1 Tax=Geodermatophilus sabuli TaxID=1564158 RepID=A0A285EJB2_9ACTN|nr:hypothetical protein [Geodermatophilus sabuli]MBB3086998.1 hypothetical protein [Geodermatophilus sabuli]SNX99222.1 hypothetical protein SAMN06893097_11614 [Geodermatophilus sabuli]
MVSRAGKAVLGAVGGAVAVAATAVAGVVVAMPDGVDGPGAVLAELQGHTDTTAYADADRAPVDLVPGWTRAVGHDVVVVRPGDASGDDGGSVRADMALDAGVGLPAACTPLDVPGMPWDGGGSWPDLGSERQLCEGWVTVRLGEHLYVWTDDALRG